MGTGDRISLNDASISSDFTSPDFDASTSDYASIADHVVGTGPYTLSAWVRVDSTLAGGVFTYRPIFIRGANDGSTSANDIEVYVQANSRDLVVAHNRGNGGTFNWARYDDPPLDSVFHLAVTYDDITSKVTVYYNGVSQNANINQNDEFLPIPGNTQTWLLGKVNHSAFGNHPGGSGREKFFEGLMDEVMMFDRARCRGYRSHARPVPGSAA